MPTLKVHGTVVDGRTLERNLRRQRRLGKNAKDIRRLLTIVRSKSVTY